jgi:CO/xanthine dehydrogenase FAD-binding subunit
MTDFEYRRPTALAEALELLQRDDVVALAGGTDLLVAIRHRRVRPAVVVDLKGLDEIGAGFEAKGDHLSIGGRVVMSRLTSEEAVTSSFPALAQAASVVGSIQIRNRATLAGNLANASPAADTAPALLAYSAAVAISGPGGARTIPMEEFFVGPGSTILASGEVVTGIEVPLPSAETGSAFGRLTRRRGVDLASLNLACAVESSGRVRFGFGAVGPTPLAAESTLDDLADDDGWSRLLDITSPISDVRASAAYRRAMLEVHSRRVLQKAVEELESKR